MIRHNLYEIDLDKKTAFCCACGYTKVHVAKSHTAERAPKVFCLNRWEELRKTEKQKRSESRPLKPGWKPRHILSEIDIEKRVAICSVCGPTVICKQRKKGAVYYYCAARIRPYRREYQRSKRPLQTIRPVIHKLSEIDEEKKTAICSTCGPVEIYTWQGKKFGCCCSNASAKDVMPALKIRREINIAVINSYKTEHGCKHCGYNRNPDRLHIHARSKSKKDPKIEKLLKLPRERLIEDLDKSYILCGICRSLGQGIVKITSLRSEIPAQILHL